MRVDVSLSACVCVYGAGNQAQSLCFLGKCSATGLHLHPIWCFLDSHSGWPWTHCVAQASPLNLSLLTVGIDLHNMCV